jgi:glycine/D-amino acid oxidase-like deaminating enzyme
MAREMKKFDRSVRWADREDLLEELPFLNDSVEGGFLFEEEAQVVPSHLLEALGEALDECGVRVVEGTDVRSIDVDGNGDPIVETSSGDQSCDAVLLAAGCWTPELLSNFSVEVPIESRKGEMLRLKTPDLPDFPPVRRGDRFVLPREDGVFVGSTATEETEPLTRACALRDLLAAAVDLVPRLDEAHFEETWSGLRPYANMKGGPFLGEVPGQGNVFYAAGHYKTGILQGPYTGKLMTDYIEGKEPEIEVTRYGPDR